MKKLGIISIIICMIFIVSFFVEQARICTIDINNISWKIELASTSYQKRR